MTSELDIGFIGAGGVNFGGAEGPWDHASRLEQIKGLNLRGVADPDIARAKRRLDERSGPLYANTKTFKDYREMLNTLDLDAVWIGVPPSAHGTMEPGKDMEVQCARAGVHIFVEKPLSSARPTEVQKVAEAIEQNDVLCSVGYMFRYSHAIHTMKDLLKSTPGGARAFIATYDCAYSCIQKPSWWDMKLSGGPIVEQATHFIDLARYLVGEPESSSLSAMSIQADEDKGQLEDIPCDAEGRPVDAGVPEERQIPRATTASWKFQNGALGSLAHGVLLHGKKYESRIEVWSDGLRMVLDDPYDHCALNVRRPHTEGTERMMFDDDDPYFTEDDVFVAAIRNNDPSLIKSSYSDASKTFELTWDITDKAINA